VKKTLSQTLSLINKERDIDIDIESNVTLRLIKILRVLHHLKNMFTLLHFYFKRVAYEEKNVGGITVG
jgi:hypothetical protein